MYFFATLSSYNFYWLISKYYFSRNIPFNVFLKKNFWHIFFFLAAGSAIVYCVYFIHDILPEIILAIILTLLYSIPLLPLKKPGFIRHAGFLKTILLAFTWTYVTVMIPASQSESTARFSISLLFTARFLFMLILCIIFDSRDIAMDKIHALTSLATEVSRQSLKRIISFLFIAYLLIDFLLRYHFNNTPQVIACIITGLLSLLVYKMSLKKQGYFFYYFGVDGLMLFSALATFVASI